MSFGNIIGGIVGATIGFIVTGGNPAGAYWGWTAGSIAGGLLFPEQIQGPRLEDLKAQSSEYGRPIPITYGTIALGGNVIWASELVEVSETSGGCGSPEVTTYSYFANFAVAICEGEVILGRIWAGPDKRLIWDGSNLEGAESGALLRFYSGSEDQLPDALIESYMGAGNVPAYRGTAYLVLENFPVAKDGNRIPFLTIEVGATVDAQTLGFVWPEDVWYDSGSLVMYHGPGFGGLLVQDSTDPHEVTLQFSFPITNLLQARKSTYDPDRHRFVSYQGGANGISIIPISSGDEETYPINKSFTSGMGASIYNADCVYHGGKYVFADYSIAGTYKTALYIVNPDTLATEAGFVYDATIGLSNMPTKLLAPADPLANYVIGYTATAIYKFPLDGGPAVSLGTMPPALSAHQYAMVDPTTGYVWVAFATTVASGLFEYAVFDPATATRVAYDVIDLGVDEHAANPPHYIRFTFGGFVAAPRAGAEKVYAYGMRGRQPGETTDVYLEFDPLTGANIPLEPTTPTHRGNYSVQNANGAGALKTMVYDPDRDVFYGFRNGYSSAIVDESPPGAGPWMTGVTSWRFGDELANAQPNSVPLDEVVADLSARAGLDPSQIDVTALENDTVSGYAIANQMDVKAAIDALRPVHFFDAVESGGVVKYVKRGGAIAATIADGELGAYDSGSEPVEDLETTRIMDEELPRIVTVRYLLEATKYDTATKIAKRLVGNSGSEAAMDLPMVLTDTKGQEVAEVNLHGPWVARLTYRFSLPRKYAYLEPTDVVAVKGYTMRIATIKQTGGRYQVEAVHDDANVYVPNVVVTETVPPPPGSEVVETISETVLELM